MYEYCLPVLRALLLSDALLVEVGKIDADFQALASLTAHDTNGASYPLNLAGGDQLLPFAAIDLCQPPTKGITGPFPRGYLYHLGSKYPDKDNEAELVKGEHTFALTAYVGGFRAEDSEQNSGRFMAACKRVIETNQYIFSGLPRAYGSSSLAKAAQIVPGHKASDAQSYHMIFTICIRELRKG